MTSWDDFKAFVGRVARANQALIYRGQSDEEWPLKSTWHRRFPDGTLDTYWRLLERVHDQISTWTGQRWDLSNDFQRTSFIGFLQHHGFPTPLLDWTRSPYIAAYFAFEGVNDFVPQSDHVVVYAFDAMAFSQDWQPVYDPFSTVRHVSVLDALASGNQKQIIQQGIYTFSNVADQGAHVGNLAGQILADGRTSPTYLLPIKIPAKEKPVAMRELRQMGITRMSLFPSVEGICKTLGDEYFAPEVIGQTPSERLEELIQRIEAERSSSEPQGKLDLGPSSSHSQNVDLLGQETQRAGFTGASGSLTILGIVNSDNQPVDLADVQGLIFVRTLVERGSGEAVRIFLGDSEVCSQQVSTFPSRAYEFVCPIATSALELTGIPRFADGPTTVSAVIAAGDGTVVQRVDVQLVLKNHAD